MKKWITGGVNSDYFVTAVRTGGKGMGGISLVVVERTEGLSTRQMDCMGVWASGTTYVTYEDVRVPVENVLGRENKGFPVIMANFNGERAGIAIQANRFARVCLEESMSELLCASPSCRTASPDTDSRERTFLQNTPTSARRLARN